MESQTKPDYELFLKELTCLSKKHGIVIEGCGCCNSPYLYNSNTEPATAHYSYSDLSSSGVENLSWNEK